MAFVMKTDLNVMDSFFLSVKQLDFNIIIMKNNILFSAIIIEIVIKNVKISVFYRIIEILLKNKEKFYKIFDLLIEK